MKIRKIALENLNSLVGAHELDLTAEPIASAGIFAITGPTGAGKSTILDAITLALYGRAARYDRPNPEDMMSRHQGRCRAEVEFEVNGEVFRASWTRHRAREKADGKMQAARRFVYDAAGTVLTQSLGEADAKVEEICGLSYERFMRSALLAQGEFARFLKSKEDERAELLESLTGTEVFSQLSALVFAETAQRLREMEDEEKQLAVISPLDADVRQAKQQAQQELEKEQLTLRSRAKQLGAAIMKADELRRILTSIEEAEKGQSALAEERAEKREQLAGLAHHKEGEPYFPILARLDDTRADLARLGDQLLAATRARDAAQRDRQAGSASAAALVQVWIRERQAALATVRQEAAKAAERSRSIEALLAEQRADATLEASLPELFGKIEALKHQRRRWSETREKSLALNKEKAAERTLQDERKSRLAAATAALAEADGGLAQAKQRLEALAAGKDEGTRQVAIGHLETLVGLRGKLRSGDAELQAAQVQLPPQQQRAQAAGEKRQLATELCASHEEHLQTEILRADLEDHRANLKPGDACPLCGAVEHPFATAATAASAETKIAGLKHKAAEAKLAAAQAEAEERQQAKRLAELEARLNAALANRATRLSEFQQGCQTLAIDASDGGALEETLTSWQQELLAVRSQRSALETATLKAEELRRSTEKLTHEQQAAEAALAKLERQLALEEAAMRAAEDAGKVALDDLAAALKPFGEQLPQAGQELELRRSLQERAKRFSEHQSALAAAVEAVRSAGLREAEIGKELAALHERASAFEGTPDADAEPWDVASMAALDRRLAALDSAATSARAAAAEREKQVQAAQAQLATREAELAAQLATSRFADAAALRSVRLGAEALELATNLEKRLAEERERLKGRLDGLAENLLRLREEAIPEGEALAAMRIENQQVDARAELVSDALATLRAELKADDKNLAELARRRAAFAEALEELQRWKRLNGLIGSADGKKFRRFAQGLSLDVLVRHANAHLDRLSERYQLARREGEELGLEIVDLFQASVTRPMSSLSGGESFLASLALALGLSDLAGRNVQIDSLFIDEGFGSLDADTLDEAISALEQLRLREKTVGVISHVDLLKERISTQVVVAVDAGGRGRIEVAG